MVSKKRKEVEKRKKILLDQNEKINESEDEEKYMRGSTEERGGQRGAKLMVLVA